MTTDSTHIGITCRGTQLQQVTRFKYLGAMIAQTTSCSHEIRARLGAARAAFHSLDTVWKDRALPKIIKLKVLKTHVWPIATYGCETWTTCANDDAKVRSFEMAGYRKILRVHWTAHRTNEFILRELNAPK